MSARSDSPKPSPSESLEKQILAAIDGRIDPVQVSMVYRLGLFVVAVAMVLLPLIYVGLIGLTGYGLYWHASENVALFKQMRGRAALFLYITPLVVGTILLLFMVKPLFARAAKQHKPRRLQRTLGWATRGRRARTSPRRTAARAGVQP